MFNLFDFRLDFFIIPLLLLNIVTIERHLLSIMKDVKNMKTKEERKDDNRIKLKGIRLKLMRKKGICLICLVLDRIFLLYFIIAYYNNNSLPSASTINNERREEYEDERWKKR